MEFRDLLIFSWLYAYPPSFQITPLFTSVGKFVFISLLSVTHVFTLKARHVPKVCFLENTIILIYLCWACISESAIHSYEKKCKKHSDAFLEPPDGFCLLLIGFHVFQSLCGICLFDLREHFCISSSVLFSRHALATV